METPEGKVSLLDAIPVRCDHILTEWEGDYAVISYPRFKYEWMRRLLLPKSMSPVFMSALKNTAVLCGG